MASIKDFPNAKKEIRLLGNSLINKIAAGEVVDRPLSVVKELVENSIDAGASMISIEVINGGIDLIRVTDNGSGIPASEVKTAFERHATSKIARDSDLDGILTLGFRGEALPSIAAVSRVEIITRHTSAITGRRIEIDGGQIISEQDIGAIPGTTFVVRNLFYNVPARFKFLKKPAVEGGYITDLVSKLALGNPGIAFKYISNENINLQTKGNNDLKTVIAQVYGREISGKTLEVRNESEDGSIKIYGCTGKPEISRGNRTYGSLFVNGRHVKSNHIQSAVEEAYKTRLMTGKFPVYVINIEIHPEMVDANVHPAKTEVRFSEEDAVYELVRDAVLNALKDNLLIPEVKLAPRKSFAEEMERRGEYRVYKPNEADEQSVTSTGVVREIKAVPEHEGKGAPVKKVEKVPEEKEILLDKEIDEIPGELTAALYVNEALEASRGYTDDYEQKFIEDYKIIGSVFGTYIIVEQNGKLLIFDQHAAHERILYEELLNKMNGPIAGQSLLTPLLVRVNQNEKRTALSNIEVFSDMGFEIEDFGEQFIAVRTLPFIFGGPVKPDFFVEMLDNLAEPGKKDGVSYGKRETIAQAACKAAVKAGDRLSNDEIKAMIDKILCMENPFSCPHGRPTVIELTQRELEKRFKRVL